MDDIMMNASTQYGTVHYSNSTVWISMVQYSTVQYSTIKYSTVQYGTVIVQYTTVQYSVQYSTVIWILYVCTDSDVVISIVLSS